MSALTIHITHHAVDRYRERVEPALTFDQAMASLRTHERAVCVAAGFGCDTVKLGNGSRLILDGLSVVTVLAPRQARHKSAEARAGYMA